MFKRSNFYALHFLLCLFLVHAFVANATEEDSRLWQTVITEGNITKNVRWYAEVQGRWKDDFKNFDQAFFRPALNYALSEKATLWLGYVYADTKTANGHTYEDRWWQQFQYVSKYNDVTWLSRSRIEQRHLETGDKTAYRFRQQFRASWPLNGRTDLSYLVWDESFWNINDTQWTGDGGFNQNRLFAGLMWKYTPSSRLEIGYLNQYVNGSNNAPDQMNHVLSSTIFIGF
jgi:hypothetical protein